MVSDADRAAALEIIALYGDDPLPDEVARVAAIFARHREGQVSVQAFSEFLALGVKPGESWHEKLREARERIAELERGQCANGKRIAKMKCRLETMTKTAADHYDKVLALERNRDRLREVARLSLIDLSAAMVAIEETMPSEIPKVIGRLRAVLGARKGDRHREEQPTRLTPREARELVLANQRLADIGEATGIAGVDAPMTPLECVNALRRDRDRLREAAEALLETLPLVWQHRRAAAAAALRAAIDAGKGDEG